MCRPPNYSIILSHQETAFATEDTTSSNQVIVVIMETSKVKTNHDLQPITISNTGELCLALVRSTLHTSCANDPKALPYSNQFAERYTDSTHGGN